MSTIKPFKAIFYNADKVKDLTKVVAPPYDVITDEQQTAYHNLSPYNFTHIDYAKDKASDKKDNNKYTRAQSTFEDWLKKNVMIKDDKDCVYFYKQEFKILGQKYSRMGFISLLELEDDGESTVHPHENTHDYAVDDRFKLTQALNSNLSCIFVCYSDKQKKVDKIFSKNVSVTKPLFDVVDKEGVRNKLWRLDDPDLIQQIKESVQGQPLFIADGHHRYKTACNYRQQQLGKKGSGDGQEPFNYVMTYFTNLDSKDLQIFPMHRIVKSFTEDLELLEEYFRVDKVKGKQELLILLAKAGKNEHAFGLYTKGGIKLLRLKNKLLIDEHIKKGSADYKSLDATILKQFVFDKVGLASEEIIYTKDMNEGTKMVDAKKADAIFIMNPVKISQLKAIALNGERMPPKTTYFYPKVLSGLTVYKMD